MKQEYAMYKGDTFLVLGTAKECADYLGVSENTIRWYSNPSAKKRSPNNTRIIAERIYDEV